MQSEINSEEEYCQVKEKVEAYLQKVTQSGGFQSLNSAEQDDLQHLSLLAEAWEDAIPLLPIPIIGNHTQCDSLSVVESVTVGDFRQKCFGGKQTTDFRKQNQST